MRRVTVNLDDEPGRLLKERAESQSRTESSYVALLVENDLRAAGLMLTEAREDDAAFWAKTKRAAKKNPALKSQIAELTARSERRRLTPAA